MRYTDRILISVVMLPGLFLLALASAAVAQTPLDTADDDPLQSLLSPVEDEPDGEAATDDSTVEVPTDFAAERTEEVVFPETDEDGLGLEEREREMLRSTLGDDYEEKLRKTGAGQNEEPLRGDSEPTPGIAPTRASDDDYKIAPAPGRVASRRLPVRPDLDELEDVVAEDIISYGDVVRIMMMEDPNLFYEGAVSANGTIPVPYMGEFPIVGLTQRQAMQQLSERLEEELYLTATVSVTLVARGGGNVYIYGAVNHQGAIEMPKYGRLTILRLILMSGGLSGWAAPEDAFIMRRMSGASEMERIGVNLKEIFATSYPESGKDVPLMDGDIVVVPGLNGELYQFMSASDREIIVVGEVGNPGIINFSAGELRTLMRAIFKAGSFTQFARKTTVKVIRYDRDGSRREMQVDVDAIMEGDLHKDIELQPGDMIIVPQKKINF